MGSAAFKRDDVEDTAILALAGELDVSCAAELRRRLAEMLDSSAATVILDLTGVTHLDTSGLAELISAHQRATANDIQLVLALGPGGLRRSIEIRGLETIFKIVDSRAEALALARADA